MEIAIVKQDLETLEGVIKKNLAAFYEVGRALMEIRDRRLYKEVKGYKTFEEYCRVEWDFSKTHANRLIESTKTIEVLTPIGVKAPTTESQTRPLTQLEPDEEYCRIEWDFSRNYANKLIGSSQVMLTLGTTVPKPPTTERQTRPLTKLAPEQQAEV